MKVLIVGAGIGGLSAAIGLRRAGHDVTILEKSLLIHETGAAIHVPPNATRILQSYNFSPTRAHFVQCKKQIYADGRTLAVGYENTWEEGSLEREFGAGFWLAHRVDLSEELRGIAVQEGEEGEGRGKKVCIETKCEVVGYDPGNGIVTLADGTQRTGDLIIAADGIHSRAVKHVVGYENPARKTGYAIFRFLIPTEVILDDAETRDLMRGGEGMCLLLEDKKDRRLVMYPCRGNRIQNVALIVPDREELGAQEGWNIDASKEIFLEEGRNFHPSVQAFLKKAEDVKLWALLSRDPLPTWHKSRLVLIGDAAHPMLPTQAQAGAQAISDGAALGILFSHFTNPDIKSISTRLHMFQNVRYNKATVMQMFSDREFLGQEAMRDAAGPFMEGEEEVPFTRAEQLRYRFQQNVFEDCERELKRAGLCKC